LYRCSECGFVTTASLENAVAAHEQGSSNCAGELDLIADFAQAPAVTVSAGRRRRRSAARPAPDAIRPAAAPAPTGSSPEDLA
jgi:hypothetical protein